MLSRLWLPLSRPCFGYLDKNNRLFGFWGTPQIWRCCPFLCEVVQGTSGPYVVQKSQAYAITPWMIGQAATWCARVLLPGWQIRSSCARPRCLRNHQGAVPEMDWNACAYLNALQVSSNLVHSSLHTFEDKAISGLMIRSSETNCCSCFNISSLVTGYLERHCQIACTADEREATHMCSWKKVRSV
jgi:hypothetical protein